VKLKKKYELKGKNSMGGGLRIDGETNYGSRKTLRGPQTL
jgi:hypothetical protein